MGQAIITQNIGDSLYKAKPLFSTTQLNNEITKLSSEDSKHANLLLNTLNTISLLENDVILARDAVNEVIKQWQDDLIKRGQEQPGPLEPDDSIDPETGKPWEDPDRAQEGPLLTAINAARTSASVGTVSRDTKLDAACLAHLRYQAGNGQIGHIGIYGSKALDRAKFAGYYNPTTLQELLAYGPQTPAATSNKMLQNNPNELLDNTVTKAGVAHVYAPQHISSYLWAVILASNEGPASEVTIEDDPGKKSAEDTEQALKGITKPEQDLLKPEKLGEAVKAFALAKQKLILADKELARIMAEKLERDQRIEELQNEKNRLDGLEFDIWCCYYDDTIQVGTTVNTAEVPGFWQNDPVIRSATLYKGTSQQRTVVYTEYAWNICRSTSDASGKLVPSLTMTPASIYFNTAIEAGHLKWKPIWRYGVLTAVSEFYGSVSLSTYDRDIYSGENLNLDENNIMENIPFEYPPCQGDVFAIGDEVLVRFVGFDRTQPRIIGFRRSPIKCPYQRTSWAML